MEPVTIGVVLATTAAAIAAIWYERKKKAAAGTPGTTPTPPPNGWSQPPSTPGYTTPTAPPGVPPSWVYQGPPTQAATSNSQIVNFPLVAGTMQAQEAAGTTLNFSLPPGAVWSTDTSGNYDPVLMPTSIGGNYTGGTAGSSGPVTLSGFAGAGTIQFNWVSASGTLTTTTFDISQA